MRLPDPIANTTTEAYLAYKAGALSEGDLKPKLYDPYIHLDAWLAYWAGLTNEYPLDKNGEPEMLTDEEAYIAYLSGVTNTYPEEFRDPADIRVAAYLRYLISARFGRPEYPVTNEELYLSMLKTKYIPSGDPSSDIVIDGTAKAPFVDVKMYGDTFQKSYTGKNLLQFIPRSGEGMTVTYDAKTGLAHVSGTNSSNDGKWSNICESVECSIPAGTYTLSVTEAQSNLVFHIRLRYADDSTGDFNIPDGSTSKTFEMPKDAKRVYIWYGGLTPTYSSVDFTVGIQLEAGSAATSFEPYVGGQPSPNPDYPQAIQTVTGEQTVTVLGKNLSPNFGSLTWSGNNITDRVTSDDEITFKLSTSANYSGVYLNKVINYDICKYYYESGYIVSFEISASAQTNFTVGQSGGAQTIYSVGTTPARISVPTGNANFIIYATDKNGARVSIKNVQVEAGSTASDYTPYSRQALPISLGSIELCKLSTYYEDYIYKDDGDWKIHKNVGKYTFSGQENWAFDTVRIPRFYLSSGSLESLSIHAAIPPNSTTMPVGLTNRFIAKTFTNFYTNNESDGFAMSTTGQNFQIGDKNWTQRTEAEAAANGLIWYYALASGYKTDTVITDQNLIAQLEALVNGGAENGTTYIKIDATDPNLPGLLYVEAPKYE